ncbi:MAG: methionine synthase [Nocardioides sp.]
MFATGIGSLPGADADAYTAAVRLVLDELADPPQLPHVPELPGRGPGAAMVGRTLSMLDLGADLQPAGWRLTDHPGIDLRRSRSLLAQDLDALEEQAQGHRASYAGPFKVQVAGPWTLAASVEKPRGDRVLADFGARRDLAQALAEGVVAHIGDVRRRLPGVSELVLQVDEPLLPAVLAGRLPTASGLHRHRSVDAATASGALTWLTEAVDAVADVVPVAHCCAPEAPIRLLRGAGFRGIAVDLALADAAAYDALAEALDAGDRVVLGVVPTHAPAGLPAEGVVIERVRRWLDMLGLDLAECGDQLGISPACGLAGGDPTWARNALRMCKAVARNLAGCRCPVL